MNHLLPLAVLAATLAIDDNSGAEKPTAGTLVVQNDKELMQGTWRCIAREEDGKEIKEKPVGETLTFKGDAVTISTSPKDKATFTVDPDKRPGMLEIVVKGENGQVKETVRLLYELKGDTLRVCASMRSPQEAPKDFNAKNGQMILTFRHEAKQGEK